MSVNFSVQKFSMKTSVYTEITGYSILQWHNFLSSPNWKGLVRS